MKLKGNILGGYNGSLEGETESTYIIFHGKHYELSKLKKKIKKFKNSLKINDYIF